MLIKLCTLKRYLKNPVGNLTANDVTAEYSCMSIYTVVNIMFNVVNYEYPYTNS